MSIERELLKKVISGDNKGDFFISYDLYKEIYEFLVHPEQPEQSSTTRHALDSYWNQEAYQRGYAEAELKLKREQEPEAWIIVNKETGYRTQVSDLTPFLYHREIFEVIPLYTAPPVKSEQEPVAWMYEWVDEVGEPVKSVVYNFYEGANLIPLYTAPPKREPLSDEEICEILLKKEWKGFVELVRIIEKEHGIGGGE